MVISASRHIDFHWSGNPSHRGQSRVLPRRFVQESMFGRIVSVPLTGTMSDAVMMRRAILTSLRSATLYLGKSDLTKIS